MKVSEALATRKSIRAFRPDPVSRETVEKILTAASRARRAAICSRGKSMSSPARRARAHPPRRRAPQDEGAGRGARISHLSARADRALQDAPLQDRRGDVRTMGIPREDKMARLGFFSRQLGILRRAGRPHHHHRPPDAAGPMGRCRHVPADRSCCSRASTDCTPARRKPGRCGTASSASSCRCRKKKWSSAVSRSATPTRATR